MGYMKTCRQDRWQTFHHKIEGEGSRQHPRFQKYSASFLPGSWRKGICLASGIGRKSAEAPAHPGGKSHPREDKVILGAFQAPLTGRSAMAPSLDSPASKL